MSQAYPIRATFSIIYNFHSPCTITEYHFHNTYEILIPFCNGMECLVGDKIYEVRRGDVFIFPPHVSHKIKQPTDTIYERYVIYFRREYLNSYSPYATVLLQNLLSQSNEDAVRIHFEEDRLNYLIRLIKKEQYYMNTPGYTQEINIQHTFFEILLLLCNQSNLHNPSNSLIQTQSIFNIADVLNYIHDNFSNDLSLDILTEQFYISKTHLNKMFKQHTGYTINQYIIDLRIATARRLLQDEIPVSLVYEMVGFQNYSHFIRTFTKIVGISPKQYAIKYARNNIQLEPFL